MPVMDGIEATRIIRKSENPRIKNIPIVALTAAIMSESHDKIEDLNINDYVLKPFKPHDLFREDYEAYKVRCNGNGVMAQWRNGTTVSS